jgi:hypothetical protein
VILGELKPFGKRITLYFAGSGIISEEVRAVEFALFMAKD